MYLKFSSAKKDTHCTCKRCARFSGPHEAFVGTMRFSAVHDIGGHFCAPRLQTIKCHSHEKDPVRIVFLCACVCECLCLCRHFLMSCCSCRRIIPLSHTHACMCLCSSRMLNDKAQHFRREAVAAAVVATSFPKNG